MKSKNYRREIRWPEEDGQANFDGLNSPYAMTSDGFVVLLENEWTLFERREFAP